MNETYEQKLKNFVKTFRNLNVQLLGFLLVAIGFMLVSEIIMTDLALYVVAVGAFFTIELWIIS